MMLNEFLERNLLVDSSGKVHDEDGNEYRDEDGKMHYLDTEESLIPDMLNDRRLNREDRVNHIVDKIIENLNKDNDD